MIDGKKMLKARNVAVDTLGTGLLSVAKRVTVKRKRSDVPR